MGTVKSLPPRSKVKQADCWDLTSLFKSDVAWEAAFKKWEGEIGGFEKFRLSFAERRMKCADDCEHDGIRRPVHALTKFFHGGRPRWQQF